MFGCKRQTEGAACPFTPPRAAHGVGRVLGARGRHAIKQGNRAALLRGRKDSHVSLAPGLRSGRHGPWCLELTEKEAELALSKGFPAADLSGIVMSPNWFSEKSKEIPTLGPRKPTAAVCHRG